MEEGLAAASPSEAGSEVVNDNLASPGPPHSTSALSSTPAESRSDSADPARSPRTGEEFAAVIEVPS